MPAESPSPVWFTRCADYGDAPASALDRLLAESGLLAADAVRDAHVSGGVPNIVIEVPMRNEEGFASLARAYNKALKFFPESF